MAVSHRWQGFGRFVIASLSPRSLNHATCLRIGRQRFFVGTLPGQTEVTLLDEFAKVEKRLRPSKNEYEQRADIEKLLHGVCEHLGGELRCYGSAVNGTWMCGSDVDMTWLLTPPEEFVGDTKSWEYEMLRKLQSKIDSIESIKRTSVIMARVPVLKIFDPRGQVLCDITINNYEGIQNTRFVAQLCKEVENLSSLVRLLKHWARQRGIADRSMGGFSTYTLVLMSARYMQKISKSSRSGCEGSPSSKQIERIRAELEIAGFESCDMNPLQEIEQAVDAANNRTDFNASDALSGFFEMFSQEFKVVLCGSAPVKDSAAQGQKSESITSQVPPPPADPPPPVPAQPLIYTSSLTVDTLRMHSSVEPMQMYSQIGWPAKTVQSSPQTATIKPSPPPPLVSSQLERKASTLIQRPPPPPRTLSNQVHSAQLQQPSCLNDSETNLGHLNLNESFVQVDTEHTSQMESGPLSSLEMGPPPVASNPIVPAPPPSPPPPQIAALSSQILPPPPPPPSTLPPPPPLPPLPPPQSQLLRKFSISETLQVFCPVTGSEIQRSKLNEWRKLFKEISVAADLMKCNTKSPLEKVERLFRVRRAQVPTLAPPPPPSSPPPEQPPPPSKPPPPLPQTQPTPVTEVKHLPRHGDVAPPPPPGPAQTTDRSQSPEVTLRPEGIFAQALSSSPLQLAVV